MQALANKTPSFMVVCRKSGKADRAAKDFGVWEALGLGIGESSSNRRGSVMGPTRRFRGPTRWNWREIIVCERVECCLGWDMQG
jgi:hypothetical protein